MKKIAALRFEYTYVDAPDSEARLDRFYRWLINKAIDNLLKKQKDLDSNSTQKYTKDNGRSGDISNTRGSSQNTQSQENHSVQDVQSGEAASHKVWQSMENKQQKINGAVGG